MAESLLTLGANANPLVNKPEMDLNSTANITNQPVNAAAYDVNNDLRSLDYARLSAQKTKIMADEVKHQESLQLPLAMSRMEENAMDAIGQIAHLNEIKRSADLKEQNRSWVTNQTIDLETKFNSFLGDAKANANPDGSGFETTVQTWLNDYEKNNLTNAPSQEGLTAMYAHTSAFKINAMRVAGDFETAMRSRNRINVSNQNVANLAATSFDNPEALASSLNQVDKLGRALSGDLKDPSDVDKFVNSSKATLYVSTLKGALSRNDFDMVGKLADNKDLQDTIPPTQFSSIMTSAAKQEEHYDKEQDKIKNATVMATMYERGALSASLPGADKVATQSFVDFLSGLGDTSQMKPQDISVISTNIVRYFSDKNYTSDDVRGMLEGKINTASNPSEVAAYSVAVNSLSTDPTLMGTKIIGKMDAKSRLRAYNIAEIMQATGDPEKAIAIADKVTQGAINAPEGGAKLLLEGWAGGGTNDVKSRMGKEYDSLFKSNWLSSSKLTDSDKAYGAAEMEKSTKQFLDAGYSVKDSLKLAGDEIRKTRAVTNVNGRDELMLGAPELYYDNVQLPKAKQIMADEITKFKASLPAKSGYAPNIGVGPWPGLTQFQSNKERWYMLMDLDNHTPIKDANGGYKVIPIRFNEEKADQDKSNEIMNLAGTRAEDKRKGQLSQFLVNLRRVK